MRRLCVLSGLGILGLALLVGAGASQEGKDKDTKIKGMLPDGFKDLGLSKEQITKIYTLQTEYNAKLKELQNKMNDLKKQKTTDEFKVLTEEQREKYLKAKGLESKEKTPPKDKAPEKDKKDK